MVVVFYKMEHEDEIDYKLGIIWQDVQHRRIVKIIKEINSSAHLDYNSIFAQLRYIIEDHFDTEEQYMREFAYDKIEPHIEEHRAFINKLDEITGTCFTDDALNITVSSFLNEWFLNHMLKVDNDLAVFLLKHERDNILQLNRYLNGDDSDV